MGRKITAEDLLRLRFVGDAQISPDGSRVAFTVKHIDSGKNKYFQHLWMVNKGGGTPRQFTSGEQTDGHPRWSPDGKQIAFTSNRQKPKSQIYIIPADGGEARALTNLDEGSVGQIAWSPDGSKIAFLFRPTLPEWTEAAKKEREEKGLSTPPKITENVWYRLDGDGFYMQTRWKVWVADAQSGETKQLTFDDVQDSDLAWSPDSRTIAFVSNHSPDYTETPQLEDIFLVSSDGGEQRRLEGTVNGPKGSLAWSPDGKHIAYTGNDRSEDLWAIENTHLWLVAADGAETRDLTPDLDNSVGVSALSDSREFGGGSAIFWSHDSTRLFFPVSERGQTHIYTVSLDGALERLTTAAGETVPASADWRREHFGLVHGNPLQPNEVYLGTLAGGEMKTAPLTRINADLLAELDLAKPESLEVTSPDGTRVQSWILRPADFDATRKYPAILEVHGGPHAMYGEVFFHEFQTLASAGYVVVYSNPRGSTGYGEAFTAAIKGDWGNVDWMDIRAVAKAMSELPYVDASRLGIMGGSYGGYMTNWAIGHTDMFKAAITDRCVTNMVSMGGTTDFPTVPDSYFPGNTWDDVEKRWEQSPLKHVGNCKTPTLIIHSEGDLRCPIGQAEELFSALRRLGIETKLIRYPFETSHGMSRGGPPDLRLHRLAQILEWWAKHLQASS